VLSRLGTLLIVAILLVAAPALSEDEPAVVVLRGAAPGPTVLVVGGIHGNEPAPPHAVRELGEIEIERGALVLVPEANVAALAKRSRHTPGTPFVDLNRNFPIRGRPFPRGRLASALWELVVRERPDLVVDVHEGFDFYRQNPKSVGNSVVYVPHPVVGAKTARLARHLVRVMNRTIDAPSKEFALLAPGPEGSYARSVTEELGIASLVLETTRVGQPLELRVAQHRRMLAEILAQLGLTAAASRPGT
jgi:predicted deacylase